MRLWFTRYGFSVRVFGFRFNVSRSGSADMYRTVQYRVSWRPFHGTKRGITFGVMRPDPYVVPYVTHVLNAAVCDVVERGCPACGRAVGTCVHTDPLYGWPVGCGSDCPGCAWCAAPMTTR